MTSLLSNESPNNVIDEQETFSMKGWIVNLDSSALFSPHSYAGPLHKMGEFHKRLSKAVKAIGAATWYYDSVSHNNCYKFILLGKDGLDITFWVSYDLGFTLQVVGFAKHGRTETEVLAVAKALAWDGYKGKIEAEDYDEWYKRRMVEANKEE